MNKQIRNGAGSVDAFDAPREVGQLAAGQLFLCLGKERKILMLGLVIKPKNIHEQTGCALFEHIGDADGIPVFKARVLDENKHETFPPKSLVLPYKCSLKVDANVSTLDFVNYYDLPSGNADMPRIGRIAFAESADEVCMGVIMNPRADSPYDKVCIIGPECSISGVRADVILPSYQFDEWHGVVDGERVFTVRSFGLLEELGKKEKQ